MIKTACRYGFDKEFSTLGDMYKYMLDNHFVNVSYYKLGANVIVVKDSCDEESDMGLEVIEISSLSTEELARLVSNEDQYRRKRIPRSSRGVVYKTNEYLQYIQLVDRRDLQEYLCSEGADKKWDASSFITEYTERTAEYVYGVNESANPHIFSFIKEQVDQIDSIYHTDDAVDSIFILMK